LEDERKAVKQLFPNLFREIQSSENKVVIDGVRADPAKAEDATEDVDQELQIEAENAVPDKFRHYNPTAVDFIRRCDTLAQAEEIVSFLLKRGEIAEDYAEELRDQLRKDGLRSFGPKKENDYYFKQGGIC
jgi:hypothetical protein